MTKTSLVPVLGSLLLAGSAFAQAQVSPPTGPPAASASASAERTARNSIFIELGGNGGIYTINYDRVVDENFSIRAGLGYVSVEGTVTSSNGMVSNAKVSMTMVPLMANYMFGGEHHKIELGGGLTFFHLSGRSTSLDGTVNATGFTPVGTAVAGYRYVPRAGGFTFRVGFTPLFAKDNFLPWAGMSFGYLF